MFGKNRAKRKRDSCARQNALKTRAIVFKSRQLYANAKKKIPHKIRDYSTNFLYSSSEKKYHDLF